MSTSALMVMRFIKTSYQALGIAGNKTAGNSLV
jgi:hypothetical protein